MKRQESVYADVKVFNFAKELAEKEERTKSYMLTKFLIEGAKQYGFKFNEKKGEVK